MDYVGIKASDLFSDKKLYWWQVILDDEPKRSVRSKYLSARWGTRSFAFEQGSASSGEKWERRGEFIGWTCMCVCVFLTNMFLGQKREWDFAPVALMISGSWARMWDTYCTCGFDALGLLSSVDPKSYGELTAVAFNRGRRVLSNKFKVVLTGGSDFPLRGEYINLLCGDMAVLWSGALLTMCGAS